jgi:hypothetical protein
MRGDASRILRSLPHWPTNRKAIQMTGLGVPLVGVVRRGPGQGDNSFPAVAALPWSIDGCLP